jgi:hypothetical protein
VARILTSTALVLACLWMASAGAANAMPPHAPLPQIALPCGPPSIEPVSFDNVQINQTDLLPATIPGSLRRPPYVQWTAPPYDGASVYDDSVHLFHSGSLSAYQVYHRTYNFAGSYAFTADTQFALLKGHVDVRVRAAPRRGSPGRRISLQWAIKRPSGRLFDVQRRAPGQTRWRLYRGGTKALFACFTPTKKGSYYVRARMRDPDTGDHSHYSPVTRIRIV